MDKLETIVTSLYNWTEDRPTIKENERLQDLVSLVLNEAYELQIALIDCISTFDLDNFLEEVSDVIIFALNIFILLDMDVFEKIMEKIAINSMRYPAGQFQTGDASSTAKRLKPRGRKIKDEVYETTY